MKLLRLLIISVLILLVALLLQPESDEGRAPVVDPSMSLRTDPSTSALDWLGGHLRAGEGDLSGAVPGACMRVPGKLAPPPRLEGDVRRDGRIVENRWMTFA